MKIGDICKYGTKSSIKAGEAVCGAEYQFFTSSEDEGKRYTEYQFDGEGIIMGTGGNATVHYYSGKYSVSTDCIVLLPDERIRCKYLYYFFEANKHVLEAGFKGAGLKHTNKKYISSIEFGEIPLITIQDKIISTLDKVKEIISNKRRQMEILDELIKARFVEMFGNPVTNDKGWEIDSCKNLMRKIGSGVTPKGGKESYCDEGISLIRSMNVYNNRFEYKDLAHITDKQAEQLSNVMIEKKDILLNITGASVARCCIVPNDVIPARVNQHVSILRCKERVLPDFVCNMFTEDNYQRLLWNIATAGGATREAITKQQIEKLKLIVPSIELQKEFVDFVHQVDKSKVEIQKALDKAQMLFDSLMQEYFG